MINKTNLGLLNDSIIGHLLCVYLKLYTPVDDKYYFIINQTDHLITAIPENLKQLGICDIKRTLGVGLISLIDLYERKISLFSELSLTAQTTQSENIIKFNQKRLKILNELLNKYKVHETPVNYSELEKIENNNEINKNLAYIISFDSEQQKKLSTFLKQYTKLFLEKELDGQQNYALPELYVSDVLNFINNPEYIKIFGYKNLQLTKKEEPFFCHSIMVLALQKKIKIRKMIVTDQSAHVIFDNSTRQETANPNEPTQTIQTPTWRDDFIWKGNTFVFGTIGSIDFEDKDAKRLFEALVSKRGNWLTRTEYEKDFTYEYIRPTVKAINTRLIEKIKGRVKIVSTKSDKTDYLKPNKSAYRILVK